MTRVDRHREEAVVRLDPICNPALKGSGQNHAPVVLPPENDPVSIVQEARWDSESVRMARKIAPPLGFDPWSV